MIKLEITKSTDPHALGTYQYVFDTIYIGRSKKCDLIFLDKEFPLLYLTLSATEKSMVIKNDSSGPSFLVNGKKNTSAAKLKTNDVVEFGGHSFKIIEYQKTTTPIDLTPFYEKISEASPEVQAALATIENALLELEKDSHV